MRLEQVWDRKVIFPFQMSCSVFFNKIGKTELLCLSFLELTTLMTITEEAMTSDGRTRVNIIFHIRDG